MWKELEKCDLHEKTEARRQLSKLRVEKSCRSYNNKNRILPGAIFMYQGRRYVLGGQKNNGLYYYPYGENSDKIHFLDTDGTEYRIRVSKEIE